MPRQISSSESLLNGRAAQMLQFVRIAHDINSDDLAILDSSAVVCRMPCSIVTNPGKPLMKP